MLSCESFIEQDLNPIFCFNKNAKLVFSNQEAQFILTTIQAKQIFDLALLHAPMNFGFHTKYLELELENSKYYALSVAYTDVDFISIKLYKSVDFKQNISFDKDGELVNIFTILDLCLSLAKIKKNISYPLFLDPSLPMFKLKVEKFINLLKACYEVFLNPKYIKTSLGIKTGEYIKIKEKKYSLISLLLESDGKILENDLSTKTSKTWQLEIFEKNNLTKISIILPLILD